MILSERVRKESVFLKNMTNRDQGEPLVASQRNGRKFNNVTLSMLFKEIYSDRRDQNVLAFRKADVCDTPQRKGGWHENHPKTDGTSQYRNNGAILRSV